MSSRLVAGLFLLAACSSATRSTPGSSSGSLTGAAAPRLAVEQFLRAVHAKDLQAMGTVFGTSRGPARETMDHTELEKREVILACYFNHDSYRIMNEVEGKGGHRDVTVELRRGTLNRATTFYVIQGPGDRWYVDQMDIAAVRDFCGNGGPAI